MGHQLGSSLRSNPHRTPHSGALDLGNTGGDQLGLDRFGVHLAQQRGSRLDRYFRNLVEHAAGVLVATPHPFGMHRTDAAQLSDADGGGGAGDAIHGRGENRDREAIGVDLPADVDIGHVAGAPARHDRDLVEAICPLARLAPADLHLRHAAAPRGRNPRSIDPGKGDPSLAGLSSGAAWRRCCSSRTGPSRRPPMPASALFHRRPTPDPGGRPRRCRAPCR